MRLQLVETHDSEQKHSDDTFDIPQDLITESDVIYSIVTAWFRWGLTFSESYCGFFNTFEHATDLKVLLFDHVSSVVPSEMPPKSTVKHLKRMILTKNLTLDLLIQSFDSFLGKFFRNVCFWAQHQKSLFVYVPHVCLICSALLHIDWGFEISVKKSRYS